MKDLIKEVAPFLIMKFWKRDQWNNEYFDGIGYSEALVEELSKRAEAVAWWHETETGLSCVNTIPPSGQIGWKTKPLFTFPPIHDIEAIENRVAEACAKRLESDANDLAQEHGYEDMGSLSFGTGEHAEAKMDRYNELIELAEALRSGEWRKHK